MVNVGDRIEMTGIMDDPNPIPVGTQGVVSAVSNVGTPYEQYSIDWDDHRRRLMLLPHDPFRVIPPVCTCEPMAGAFEIRDPDCRAH